MTKKRVLVALSGGVDSAVAAARLIDDGYEVEGAIMIMHGDGVGVDDADRIAAALNIPLHVFDMKAEFSNYVVDPFVSEYLSGCTPNPCVACNKHLKFGAFLDKALEMGFDYIATGHYARIIQNDDGSFSLCRAKSGEKDQTYALYNMTGRVLSHLLLPLGEMTKGEAREYAKQKQIPVADKPDSQDICFIPDGDYAAFIKARGYACPVGDFVDVSGNVLGKHRGIYHYTVGQRKHLGIALGHPAFVTNIDVERCTVTLGDDEDTFSDRLTARDVNWIGGAPSGQFECMAKIRYNGPASPAVVTANGEHTDVFFPERVRAVTPGQSVVFYDDDTLLGGGIIE